MCRRWKRRDHVPVPNPSCVCPRNDEDTSWTLTDETKTVNPTSLVDLCLWDHIKTDSWDRIAGVFPQGDKYSPKHKWVLMTEDTKSLVPYRYQQYDITVKLNPDKDHKLHSTFGNLSKTYPTLWICCVHYNCMTVYDVTNSNDTQWNFHLTDNHT
jgi:hypothetical protein